MSEPQYDHIEDLGQLEGRLGYAFDDLGLLERALTHRSFANERDTGEDNQRLEFLGDSALGLVVAERMFELFPGSPEGALSSWLASLVNEDALQEVARSLELGSFVRLGRGEQLSGGRSRSSVLADAYEAVLAAIYLDGGLESVRSVVLDLHAEAIDNCSVASPPEDHKSRLQRFAQAKGANHPRYDIIDVRGPDHARTFVAAVWIDSAEWGRGEGRSKKQAEQAAASVALGRWEEE